MTMDTDRHHVSRLEVIHTGRRRRWTAEEKIRIVEESFSGRNQACVVARRYDIAPSQLFGWRKAYKEGRLHDGQAAAVTFVEATIVPDAAEQFSHRPQTKPDLESRMEIVLGNGRRLIVGADVDADALGRVLAVLEGR